MSEYLPETVLIIDNHLFVCELLADFLVDKWKGVRVNFIESHDELTDKIEDSMAPDLVILDCGHPGVAAQEILNAVRDAYPSAKIVVFSAALPGIEVAAAFDLGAIAYVPKDVGLEVLSKILDLVVAGVSYVPTEIIADLMDHPPARLKANHAGSATPPSLSQREEVLLTHFLHGDSNKVVAHNMDLSESAVKQLARGLFKKLNVNNRTQAAVVAVKLGIASNIVRKQ
nr:response regulator transcription factor [uncultured Hyphomonas sp.]